MKADTALLVIDMQNGMFMEPYPVYDSQGLLERISGLIQKARASHIPVIYVQHNEGEGGPLETNSEGWNIHPLMAPTSRDIIIQKHTPDSFHETDLHAELTNLGITKVVAAGVQTDLCIDATCRQANELGYRVTVIKDGHSTWSQGNQSAPQIIASYNDRFQSFADTVVASDVEFCPV
ncbi:cysteine hydrolase family protein [Paenibacillus allorhizosphaerae]|uniref:Streptothricin hydrolase n=1 Tax=Paenibacillus allorhizosphaerae TaxID=2849866 RepID=A0ABN7TJL6_9BACL|nr:cysteine hydrolase family protein [Paenibacillus allorhizosphaerae]CAG7639148.1 Streptothricin hydrolase [Paenibacillus allorhizosphaerae]